MKRPQPVQARKVLQALTDVPMTAAALAIRAGLPGRERTSVAERICEALERRGLAERGGSKQQPKWRQVANANEPAAAEGCRAGSGESV